MGLNTGSSAVCASSIFAILADDTCIISEKCLKIAEILNGCRNDHNSGQFFNIGSLALPSLLHLLDIAPKPQDRALIHTIILQLRSSRRLWRIHSLLSASTEIAGLLATQQSNAEETWSNQRKQGKHIDFDDVGASLQDLKAAYSFFQMPQKTIAAAEEQSSNLIFCSQLLQEIRRMVIACELQLSPHPKSPWHHLPVPALPNGDGPHESPESDNSTAIPITFESPILQRATLDMKMTIPILFAILPPPPQDAAPSATENGHRATHAAKCTSTAFSSPQSIIKAILAFLQVPQGEELSLYLLFNIKSVLMRQRSSFPVHSLMSDVCKVLIEYLHLLQRYHPSRSILPHKNLNGPFSARYLSVEKESSASTSSTKGITEHVLGSGFPRRLASIQGDEPLSSETERAFYHIPSTRHPSNAVHGHNPINLEAESLVASRVESLLHLISQNLLGEAYVLFPGAGLHASATTLTTSLTNFFVLPEIRLLRLFGSASPSDSYTTQQMEWIRHLGTTTNDLERLEWRKFLRLQEPLQIALCSKVSKFPEAALTDLRLENSYGTNWSRESILDVTYNWLEFFCRFTAIFKLPTSRAQVQSIKRAVDVLLQLLEQDEAESRPKIEESFELAFCALALFVPDASMSVGEVSIVFALFSQIIGQLSSVESLRAHAVMTLFRLFQQLHHLQRHELIAQCVGEILNLSVDPVWLVKGLQNKFQACAPGEDANGKAPNSHSANGNSSKSSKQRTIQVCMSDAWNWSASLSTVAHLSLCSLFAASRRIITKTSTMKPSIISVFEQDELVTGNFTKKSLKSSVWKELTSLPTLDPHSQKHQQAPLEHDSSKMASWRGSEDPWLPWISMRLLLHMTRSADFQRFSMLTSTSQISSDWPSGGNHDGVATVLWKMLQNLSAYICLPLPHSTYFVHSIVFETLVKFSEVVLEGEQRMWSGVLLESALSAAHCADLTQLMLSPSTSGVLCHVEPENIFQVFILATLAYCKSPSSSPGASVALTFPAMTPHNDFTSPTPTAETMDVDSVEVDDWQMKRSEFLANLARYNGSSSVNMFSAPLISHDKKRYLLSELRSTLGRSLDFSPIKVLVLSKAMWIEFLVPKELTTSTKKQWLGKGPESIRVATPVFDLIRKKCFDSFIHIKLFSELCGLKSLKKAVQVPPHRTIGLDFTFLGGDYRSLVSNHPFLANVPFSSLNNLSKLEHFLIDSVQQLLLLNTAPQVHWAEERLILLFGWSCRFVHFERTLATMAHAILSPTSILDTPIGNLSQSVDATHQNLIHSPERLFNFNLKLLQFPSLFNAIFYKLTQYYYRLSKADIGNLLKTTDMNKEAQADAEDDADNQSNSTTAVSTPTSFNLAAEESTDGSTTRALIDPFHLRGIPKHKRSKDYASLQGGRKMTADDAELLIRLQDSALVQLLIDLVILVEDLVDDSGVSVEQGTKIELQTAIAANLQQLFVNDAPLMTLVHHQTYPARAIPLLVELVPAMHFCLELAPNMLASAFQKATTASASDASLQATCFPIKMAAWTVKRFPTQRSLDVTTYLLELYRAAGNSLNSSIWTETLPDIARLVLTFPSLLPAFFDLILTNEGSTLGPSASASSASSSASPSHHTTMAETSASSSVEPISLESLSHASPLSARQVLRHVLSQITQGEHLAPFLRA